MPSINLPCSATTYINSSNPTQMIGNNFSDGTYGGGTAPVHGLVKFNFSTMPANAKITAVNIYVMTNTVGMSVARDHGFLRCLRNWGETTASWNKFNNVTNWGTAGANAATDFDANYGYWGVFSVPLPKPAGGVTFMCTLPPAEVQKWYDGTYTNYGLVMRTTVEGQHGIGWRWRAQGGAPYLAVTYTLPSSSFFIFF